jgi:hypothetical protein
MARDVLMHTSMRRNIKKLNLNKETIRTLTKQQTAHVVAGRLGNYTSQVNNGCNTSAQDCPTNAADSCAAAGQACN